ncbi:MAG: DUF6702 family protein [Longimicrobiales bacterium]
MVMRRRRASRIAALLCALAALPSAPAPLNAHPLHNSFTELTFDARSNRVTASVRVFTDDFTRHVAGPAGDAGSTVASQEQRAARYITKNFTLVSRGAAVPLTWCGWKRVGEMTSICLTGPVAGGLRGVQLRNVVLMDLFTDQINIVKGGYGGSKHFMLFTAKDRVHSLL